MALRVARQAGLDEAATRACSAARWPRCSTASGLPAITPATRTLDHALRPPRARVRLRQPRRSGPVHRRRRPGAGDARHGDRGLPRPRAGVRRGGARDDRRGAERGRRPARRPRTASARRSTSSIARSSAPPPRYPTSVDRGTPVRRPRSHTAAHSPLSRRSRSRRPNRSPNARAISSTSSFSSPPASRCAGAQGIVRASSSSRGRSRFATTTIDPAMERLSRPSTAAPACADRNDAPRSPRR